MISSKEAIEKLTHFAGELGIAHQHRTVLLHDAVALIKRLDGALNEFLSTDFPTQRQYVQMQKRARNARSGEGEKP